MDVTSSNVWPTVSVLAAIGGGCSFAALKATDTPVIWAVTGGLFTVAVVFAAVAVYIRSR